MQGSDEGSSQFFDSSDNPSLLKSSSTEDSASSSAGGDAPPSILLPIMTQQQQQQEAALNRPMMSDRIKVGQNQFVKPSSGNFINQQFDPFSMSSSMVSSQSVSPAAATLSVSKPRSSGSSPQSNNLDKLLSDFDPFALAPPSNMSTPPFPVQDEMSNNNRPLGTKPKVRQAVNKTPMLQPQPVNAGGSAIGRSNLGFDDNFTPPPPLQRRNPFDNTSSHSHVNQGYYDPFQPDFLSAFGGGPTSSSPSAFTPSFNNTSKTNGSAFQGLSGDLRQSDSSGIASGSLSSQEHLSHRTDSSSSSGNASFLTSSQDSSKTAEGTLVNNGDSDWSMLQNEGSLGTQQATSSSLGTLPSHIEAEKVHNGGVRSQSVDNAVSYSQETLALYGEKLQVIIKLTMVKYAASKCVR